MNTITIGTILTDGKKDYYIEEFLGSGGFANVYKASSGDTYYAIKVLNDFAHKYIQSIKNEFDIASKVKSEHAIQYYYVNEHGQNDFPCFIIMEYAGDGSLYDNLEYHRQLEIPYSTDELLNIFSQLIDGMLDISKVAVHRDIKPENILVSNKVYKISDYGLAKYTEQATRSVSKTMKGYGTDLYYAPELWAAPESHGINDVKVDIYAMGIVFYQLANLNYPYDMTRDHRTMHMTAAVKPFNKNVDPVFQSLIRKMLEKSKLKRFDTWEQIKEFLDNSSVGNGIKRDAFVEGMLRDTVAKQKEKDKKTTKAYQEETERLEVFRRLISQIETEIYIPVKEIVDAFNADSTIGKKSISDMDIDEGDESLSFEYKEEALSESDDDRIISFSFTMMHTEELEPIHFMPTFSHGYDYSDISDTLMLLNDSDNRIKEYKYYKDRILLWGIIGADCGAGINIAILEDPEDLLYGKLKVFVRTPNIEGTNIFWIPIDDENELRKLCRSDFREFQYTTTVKDFDFGVIKELIKINSILEYDSIKDPFNHNTTFSI